MTAAGDDTPGQVGGRDYQITVKVITPLGGLTHPSEIYPILVSCVIISQ